MTAAPTLLARRLRHSTALAHRLTALIGAIWLLGPGNALAEASTTAAAGQESADMWMSVDGKRFAVTLAETGAARSFAARLPVAIELADLNGNEKHGQLDEALPEEAVRPGLIHAGDVMLYGSRTLVVFYRTFESQYSYTRLGRVEDTAGLAQALGTRRARFQFFRR